MSLFQDNSKEFDINNEKIQIIDNNPYYVLPENTKIYFGSKSIVLEKQPTFFGFDFQTAKKYGFVKKYTTTKELHLLALMELTPEHSFYQKASEYWKTKMKTIFGVGEKIKERNSEGGYDRKMMNYLCEQNMDGYAMNGKYKSDKEHGDFFHAELVLCNPIEDAVLIDAEDHTVKSNTPPRLDRKRKSKLEPEPEEEEENYPYFNNSSYDSPEKKSKSNHDTTQNYVYNTPGGKGKNKKTKRKLRKSKKSKRKQRKTRKK